MPPLSCDALLSSHLRLSMGKQRRGQIRCTLMKMGMHSWLMPLLLLLLVVVGRVALKVRVVLRVVRDEDHVLVEDLLLLVERELLEGVELVDEDLPLLVDDEVLWLGLLVLALVLALILCGVAVREVRGVVDKRGGGGRVSLLLRQQLLRLLRLLLLLLLLLCRRRRRLLLLGHGFPCFLPSFVASCLLSMIVLDLAPRA
mmetsp:Transcript_11038/g.27106  ORF Transcript_11038/g.27106 Transcript_11038/m.27106 type:complete len:200 (+) Transcript_11038:1601-2200(+)